MAWRTALIAAAGLLGIGSPNTALPDPRETPGAVDIHVMQANIDDTICRSGYARSVRPPYSVMRRLKREAMIANGHYGERYSIYEFDHLVPLALGGAPLDRRNLWLEPIAGPWNAGQKDDLEYVLWVAVCHHRVGLAEAQRAIAGNWIAAHRRWIGARRNAGWHHND